MSSQLEYKGYIGSAEVDVESGHLYGQLLFIRDAISYSAESVPELQSAFQDAVDDYLKTCAEEGEEPDVPCKGSFNVRIGPERHRAVAVAARRMEIGLNDFVCRALDVATGINSSVTIVHRHEHVSGFTGEHREWTRLIGGTTIEELDRDRPKH